MSAALLDTVDTPVDTSRCESEPIRFPGAVQPHGALLVLHPASGVVLAASESCAKLLGRPVAQLLGQPAPTLPGLQALAALLQPQWPAAPGEAPAPDQPPAVADAPPLLPLQGARGPLTAQASLNQAGQWLVDIEPGDPQDPLLHDLHQRCRAAVAALRRIDELPALMQAAAAQLRALSGFERVMVYRFDAAWNGAVVAESVAEGLEPYLGLNYPASDIPRQARELFQSSRLRPIPDARYAPSALLAAGDPCGVDLGRSALRSVSPLHLEYLANMGVRATLVGSLVVEGRLWGLLSCQHVSRPRYLEPAHREALGWLCEDLAALIQDRQMSQRRRREADLALRRRRLVDRVRQGAFDGLLHANGHGDLLDVVGADGFALLGAHGLRTTGHTPAPERIHALLEQHRRRAPGTSVYASTALDVDLGLPVAGNGVAGALFVSVQHKPAMTMIWFRRERSYSVRWGGNPHQAHLADASGRLSPRKSFAQFLQDVRGQSLPWTPEELDSAVELAALIEIESLRVSEAFAHTVLDSMPEHISVLDAHGVIVAVNASWRRFACAMDAPDLAEQSVGLSYRAVCESAAGSAEGLDGRAAWAGIAEVLQGRRDRFTMDYPCRTPEQLHWFRMSVNPMRAPGRGALVAHEDITARKRAEQALQAESEKNQALLRNASDGIHILDAQGRLIEASDSFCAMLGHARVELLGEYVGHWDCHLSADALREMLARHLASAARVEFKTRHRRRDGSELDVEVSGRALLLQGQPVLFYSARDISERTQAAARLHEAGQRLVSLASRQAQHLRELARELTQAEQRERERLHTRLHDEVQPRLVAARLLLSGPGDRSSRQELQRIAAEACTQIGEVLETTRNLGTQLSLPLVIDQGLQPALESLCRWVRRYHLLEVTLQARPGAEPQDPALRLLCFNAVRELLMNVAKHAGTHRAQVTLSRLDAATLAIEVADDGCGHEPGTVGQGSGLAGIQRRLAMFGGELQMHATPGGGTRVRLQVPLHEAGTDAEAARP